jgi:O-antigen/teichoic acid export membrane protein
MSADALKKFVFTNKYESALDFIIYWGAINAVSYAGVNASIALQVIREFSSIAKVNFITMIVTLCAGYILIQTHAVKGALIASFIGEALFTVILWGIVTQRYFLTAKPLPSLLPRTGT